MAGTSVSFMDEELLLSGIECFISVGNVVIGINDSYDHIQKLLPPLSGVPVVSNQWLQESVHAKTILPFVGPASISYL